MIAVIQCRIQSTWSWLQLFPSFVQILFTVKNWCIWQSAQHGQWRGQCSRRPKHLLTNSTVQPRVAAVFLLGGGGVNLDLIGPHILYEVQQLNCRIEIDVDLELSVTMSETLCDAKTHQADFWAVPVPKTVMCFDKSEKASSSQKQPGLLAASAVEVCWCGGGGRFFTTASMMSSKGCSPLAAWPKKIAPCMYIIKVSLSLAKTDMVGPARWYQDGCVPMVGNRSTLWEMLEHPPWNTGLRYVKINPQPS